MSLNYRLVLLLCPPLLLNVGIQVVVPSLTALFPYSAWEMLSNMTPVLGALLQHKLHDEIIFLLSPWPFDEFRIENFLPSVQALDIRTIIEVSSYPFPIFRSKLINQLLQLIILLGSPPSLARIESVLSALLIVERPSLVVGMVFLMGFRILLVRLLIVFVALLSEHLKSLLDESFVGSLELPSNVGNLFRPNGESFAQFHIVLANAVLLDKLHQLVVVRKHYHRRLLRIKVIVCLTHQDYHHDNSQFIIY